MRRGSLFWGVMLILLGVLFLLDGLGFLAFLGVNAWGLFGPLFLIGLGLWVLWGISHRRPSIGVEQATIPLGGAGRAHLRLQHGAGRLLLSAGAAPGQVLSGSFAGGADCQTRQDGDTLHVDVRMRPRDWAPFVGPWDWGMRRGFEWSLGLSSEVPLAIELETGASESLLNLTDLCVTELTLKTGASSSEIKLPARAGQTRVRVQSGMAGVKMWVPGGVAARIRVDAGLAGIDVDQTRFPRAGGVYQSPDYGTAANKIDIWAESGVGSIQVR